VVYFDVHPNSVERLPNTLTESSVLGVIPARFGATRLPGKILADIGGKPMIEHVYRRASAAALVHAVIVATDDERIADAVRSFGGVALMTRADHVSGTDRIAEVVRALPCRIIVNVQGDEPLIEPETIDAAVEPLLADPSLEMSTLSRRFTSADEFRNPNVVKVVTNAFGDAMYFSRSPIPYSAPSATLGNSAPSATRDVSAPSAALGVSAPSAALGVSAPSAALGVSAPSAALDVSAPSAARAHVGLYVYRRETLLKLAAMPAAPLEREESLEQLRALAHGIRIRVVDTHHVAAGVDTPEDLERVRLMMMASSRI
jgi:3-deoxy-manno-octulosonate cytidylyltransferase (CMP-KDO synthetase)